MPSVSSTLDKLSIHLVTESVHLTVIPGISKTMADNWETDHLQHDLDISYNFTLARVFVSHACTQINMNTFINDLVPLRGIHC